MTDKIPTFSLLTKLLDSRHIVVLQDWLEFLTVQPEELVIYLPNDVCIHQEITRLSKSFQFTWRTVEALPDDNLFVNETPILLRMVSEVRSEYLLLINLDTLPYRSGFNEVFWLQEVFKRLADNDQLVFFSGCGVVFRADELESSGKYRRTQRFSNNFGLLRKEFWLRAISNHKLEATPLEARRFHSEWALEKEFRQNNLFGLRRVETLNWRVFHVQQWDERLLQTRQLFRKGVRVDRYLNRLHEDYIHRWDYYYNFPKPPLIKRLRVVIGKYRRLIFAHSFAR